MIHFVLSHGIIFRPWDNPQVEPSACSLAVTFWQTRRNPGPDPLGTSRSAYFVADLDHQHPASEIDVGPGEYGATVSLAASPGYSTYTSQTGGDA